MRNWQNLMRASALALSLLLTACVPVAGMRIGARPEAAGPVVVEVRLRGFNFEPAGLLIQPGDTVRFVSEGLFHTVTSYNDRIPPGAAPFESRDLVGLLNPGGVFNLTFTVPGTYDYFCVTHQFLGMRGSIIVGQPGGRGSDINTGEPTVEEILAPAPEMAS
ncbi:MAG: hypothetical protein HY335_04735 [Deinococcus sp.]|nr:hypothetical protein [Deinococcus sp.]